MKALAAAGVLVISVVVIALQLTGWSQTQPKTVNLSSATRPADGPVIDSAAAGPSTAATPPTFQQLHPTATNRFVAEVRRTTEYIWPAQGPISSYFGAYHVLGIDIALDNSEDSPILAAAPGKVEFAGGSACCEYGLYVVLGHDGNRSTLYGHLSKIEVWEGEDVVQGQLLGYGGSTGVSDGKHLHFEMHDGERLVDPLRYLPAAERSTQLPSLRTDCSSDFVRVDPESKLTLEFGDAMGYRPVSVRFDDDATTAGFTAGIEGLGGMMRRVAVSIPAAPTARGFIRDASLSVTLSDGSDQRTLECAMRLATMVTMANAPRVTRHSGTSGPPGTPTATPIRSKYPTPTPPAKPGATATPTRPTTTGVASSTASTPRPGTTPPPAATQPKTAPTVKPPQQFPLTR